MSADYRQIPEQGQLGVGGQQEADLPAGVTEAAKRTAAHRLMAAIVTKILTFIDFPFGGGLEWYSMIS
jgi:hypothetical protein